MIFYPNEKDIETEILASLTVELEVPLSISDKPKEDLLLQNATASAKNATTEKERKSFEDIVAAVTAGNSPDLMYGSAILVSTCRNKNDDLFTAEETWAARYTPINQPYNNLHVKPDIIGHIIASRCLVDGKDVTASDTIPDEFDIEVDWVMYQSLNDDFATIAEDIREKGVKGELGVSMECKIKSFDYGLEDQTTGEILIIARNEETSFLTKKLRVYGGTGEYNGKKVVRALKDIRFTGMGNVPKPANPRSTYTKIDGKKISKASTNSDISACIDNSKPIYLIASVSENNGLQGNTSMKIENLEQAAAKIEELQAKLDAVKTSELQKQIEAKDAELKTVSDKLVSATEQLAIVTKAKTDAETKATELTKTVEDAVKAHELVNAELTKIKTNELALKRIAELGTLGYKVEANEISIAKYAKMSEESYSDIKICATEIAASKTSGTEKTEDQTKTDAEAKAAADKAIEDAKKTESTENKTESASASANQEKSMSDIITAALNASRAKVIKVKGSAQAKPVKK